MSKDLTKFIEQLLLKIDEDIDKEDITLSEINKEMCPHTYVYHLGKRNYLKSNLKVWIKEYADTYCKKRGESQS